MQALAIEALLASPLIACGKRQWSVSGKLCKTRERGSADHVLLVQSTPRMRLLDSRPASLKTMGNTECVCGLAGETWTVCMVLEPGA